MFKRFFGNLIDILCLSSCGIFACIVTKTVPVPPEGFSLPQEHLIGLGATLLLLLVFRRLTKMVWNLIYCVTTIVLVAALLQWATKGLLMPPVLQEMVIPYSIPVMLEDACYYELGSFALLWLMGALCSHGFWRVTITAVGSYAVWLILSLILHITCKAWLNMDNAPLADLQPLVREYPCITAAFPGCLILCYAVLMSMFDALFLGWPSKDKELREAPTPKPVAPLPQAPAKTPAKTPAKVPAKPVALATAASAQAKPKPAAPPAVQKAEVKAPAAEAPKEEKKADEAPAPSDK